MKPKSHLIMTLLGLIMLAGGSVLVIHRLIVNQEPAVTSVAETAEPLTIERIELRTPLPPVPEENLESAMVRVPEAIIVSGRQSLAELASYFMTTPEQLLWTNPDLTDPVQPGTLVIIPAVYRTSEGDSLSGIAETTRIPEELLSAANPDVKQEQTLAAGTLLAVPSLYLTESEMTIEAVADILGTAPEQLLSANPDFSADERIRAGSVLFAPLSSADTLD